MGMNNYTTQIQRIKTKFAQVVGWENPTVYRRHIRIFDLANPHHIHTPLTNLTLKYPPHKPPPKG